MRARISSTWDDLRSSFWFVPALLVAGAAALSLGLLRLDHAIGADIAEDAWFIYGGGPEGAREVLAAIVASMISVTSVVFSITIVALTLASSQFGPRLLRNFMRDRANQVTLGTFLATFVYAILGLRSIRSLDEAQFVPPITVTAGVLLVFASVGVLIFFIHHVATSIQADDVIDRTATELRSAIDRIYGDPRGKHTSDTIEGEPQLPGDFSTSRFTVNATQDNYLQAIDTDHLLALAHMHDLVIELPRRPGHFIIEGATLASVWPATRQHRDLIESVRRAFVLGPYRTFLQDPEYGMQQLVEIAVRALSPGVNDPFTAITCIDRLAAALAWLMERNLGGRFRADPDDPHRPRLITSVTSFAGFADTAFNQIRQNAGAAAAVHIRLLEAIAAIAERTRTAEHRAALREHAALVREAALRQIPSARDRRDVEERFVVVSRLLPA